MTKPTLIVFAEVSVVTSDIPENVVAAGVPARVVRAIKSTTEVKHD